jgi:hypothetical protein
MRRLFTLLVPVFILAGCAHSAYVLDGDTLEVRLRAPGASSVLFLSSLDGYAPRPAMKEGKETWVVRVPAGREFSYFYKVDGQVFLPECGSREYDDLGSESCVYVPGM